MKSSLYAIDTYTLNPKATAQPLTTLGAALQIATTNATATGAPGAFALTSKCVPAVLACCFQTSLMLCGCHHHLRGAIQGLS